MLADAWRNPFPYRSKRLSIPQLNNLFFLNNNNMLYLLVDAFAVVKGPLYVPFSNSKSIYGLSSDSHRTLTKMKSNTLKTLIKF